MFEPPCNIITKFLKRKTLIHAKIYILRYNQGIVYTREKLLHYSEILNNYWVIKFFIEPDNFKYYTRLLKSNNLILCLRDTRRTGGELLSYFSLVGLEAHPKI